MDGPQPPSSGPPPPFGQESLRGPQVEASLIIAVDFGDEHTSVAYLTRRGVIKEPDKASDDIKVLQSWPSLHSSTVPTKISYTPSSRGCRQWGYDIDDNSTVQKGLLSGLEEKSREQELDDLVGLVFGAADVDLTESVPAYLCKGPEQVAKDFLSKLAEFVADKIQISVGRLVLGAVPTDLVVSYPSLWLESTKRRYFHVIASSFSLDLFPKLSDTYFVAETEATAQWGFLSDFKEDRLREFGEYKAVIVCDTSRPSAVVATSYLLDRVDHDGTPELNFRRIGYLSRAKTGWFAVDAAFKQHVSSRLSEADEAALGETQEGGNTIIKSRWRMLASRFEPIMHSFDGKDQIYPWPLQLPRGIGTEDDPTRGILSGALTFTCHDLRAIFSGPIDALLELILQQMEFADNAGTPAKAILLTGPFARQPYVAQRVKALGMSRGMRVSVPDDGNHYGVASGEPYNPVKSTSVPLQVDPVNSYQKQQVREQIQWIVGRGEPIFPDVEDPRHEQLQLSRIFRYQDIGARKVARVVFVACGLETPPSRLQDLETQWNHSTIPTFTASRIVNLNYELSDIPGEQREPHHLRTETSKTRLFSKKKPAFFQAMLSIDLHIDTSVVKVTLSCGNKVLAEQVLPF
ncbi:hypothetical protein B0H66DRAFT_607926 [Apodospora peruviana]|uniref:Actin-like ATPase domain-containing protein n=1 Tax=Apodospora peruviana TaxID=516989 RepID=A0AAE0LYY3_9PEZI|nr:hypothetical protein B0H66DRAFT_607926 [Apodospora peruviana]